MTDPEALEARAAKRRRAKIRDVAEHAITIAILVAICSAFVAVSLLSDYVRARIFWSAQ